MDEKEVVEIKKISTIFFYFFMGKLKYSMIICDILK